MAGIEVVVIRWGVWAFEKLVGAFGDFAGADLMKVIDVVGPGETANLMTLERGRGKMVVKLGENNTKVIWGKI